MKKVSIIYWSNGGNVELLANSIAEGARNEDVEVIIKHVIDATHEDVITADAIAVGSPAMFDDEIEQLEMRPFINSLANLRITKKPLVLFGSCGWRDDKFIHNWQETMENYGFEVMGKVVSKESIKEEELQLAKNLGRKMIK